MKTVSNFSFEKKLFPDTALNIFENRAAGIKFLNEFNKPIEQVFVHKIHIIVPPPN